MSFGNGLLLRTRDPDFATGGRAGGMFEHHFQDDMPARDTHCHNLLPWTGSIMRDRGERSPDGHLDADRRWVDEEGRER